jgi:hypothetical protein
MSSCRWAPLTLKGFDQPVAANRVVWAPAPERRIPLPRRLAAAPDVGVHTRDVEQARIGELLKETLAGEPRVVFVSGEAGIGKTTLSALVAQRVYESGATVCTAGATRAWR